MRCLNRLKGAVVVSDLLSVIIPAFNEAENIDNTAKTVLHILDENNIIEYSLFNSIRCA